MHRILKVRCAFVFGFVLLVIASCPRHCSADQAEESMPKIDNFVTVYGAKIHYVEIGKGVPVILIHGLADDNTVWDSVIPPLSKRFRVIALDQIGFGQSDKPLVSYRVSTFVDFLDGFLTELRIGRASLVGNSLGGWIAAAFAIAHPERVERLALSDAAGYAALAKTMDPRALSALRGASREDIRYFGPLTFHDKRFYENVDLAFKQRVTAGDGYTNDRVIDSIVRGDDVLDGRLGAIDKPTLILWGREDKLIPLSFGERFHREIMNSRLQIIDNCGHVPQLERPAQYAAAVLEFFSGVK
jgi:2-hydroxy-6-oxonona-2,4-dienedioate hydrolase